MNNGRKYIAYVMFSREMFKSGKVFGAFSYPNEVLLDQMKMLLKLHRSSLNKFVVIRGRMRKRGFTKPSPNSNPNINPRLKRIYPSNLACKVKTPSFKSLLLQGPRQVSNSLRQIYIQRKMSRD